MVNRDKRARTAKRLGTPCYLYDKGLIRERYSDLKKHLPPGMKIFYAVKANPNKDILSLFSKLGAGCDVASGGELKQVLRAGIKVRNISFAGPGKTEEEIELAIKKRVGSISVENMEEIKLLDKLSRRAGKTIDVAVRINPTSGSSAAGIRMGGGSQQFGIDEETVPEVIRKIQASKNLRFGGIHMHTGSQVLSEEAIADNVAYLLDYCLKIQEEMKAEIRTVNFGGGLGIPYHEGQKGLDIKKLGNLIKGVFEEKDIDSKLKGTRFIVEPGRFLVGEAGVYVTKVLYKKVSRNKTFLIVDGGMHHNLAAAGLLGAGLKRNRIMGAITRKKKRKREKVTVAGCLCTPLDILARDITLPACEPGDLLYVTCSGAYGYSASPLGFLSHSLPEERMI